MEVRALAGPVTVAMPGRPESALKPQRTENGWTVTLRDIRPWQVQVLLVGNPAK